MHTKFPMQPIVKDAHGVVRFKENRIVSFLLNAGKFDMNTLALMPFDREERAQFAQLIGYSVSGYGELPYVTDAEVDEADAAAANLSILCQK